VRWWWSIGGSLRGVWRGFRGWLKRRRLRDREFAGMWVSDDGVFVYLVGTSVVVSGNHSEIERQFMCTYGLRLVLLTRHRFQYKLNTNSIRTQYELNTNSYELNTDCNNDRNINYQRTQYQLNTNRNQQPTTHIPPSPPDPSLISTATSSRHGMSGHHKTTFTRGVSGSSEM